MNALKKTKEVKENLQKEVKETMPTKAKGQSINWAKQLKTYVERSNQIKQAAKNTASTVKNLKNVANDVGGFLRTRKENNIKSLELEVKELELKKKREALRDSTRRGLFANTSNNTSDGGINIFK